MDQRSVLHLLYYPDIVIFCFLLWDSALPILGLSCGPHLLRDEACILAKAAAFVALQVIISLASTHIQMLCHHFYLVIPIIKS